MNARRILLTIAFLVTAMTSDLCAQGFAGLGSTAEGGFAVPTRGSKLAFPRDHGAHPNYRVEWWYITANLEGADGRTYGVQWTLFRSALAPGNGDGWADPQIWIGHAAITTIDGHYVAEKLGRGGTGQAGVEIAPFEAWIDDWSMKQSLDERGDPLSQIDLNASGTEFQYQLTLSARTPLVLQGDKGYSVKSAKGQASYYYSQPFYEVRGSLSISGKAVQVSGKAWLDREWSSQPLADDQTGWDWFSLHLPSGDKIMAFRLRDGTSGFVSANWITADGETRPMTRDDITMEPLQFAKVEGRDIPVVWRIHVPGQQLDITTKPLNEQAWMKTSTPYWEGPIAFSGSATGVGYLEMTGY